MKIKINRDTLLSALSEVSTFVPAKQVMQILKYARITTKGNRIKIEASDSQCSIIKYMELIECDTDGVFLIDIVDFNKLIASIKGETITIIVTDSEISIEHANGSATFAAIDANDYPATTLPATELTEINLPTKLLQTAISRGKGFISTDTLRPQLGAIYAYIKEGEFGYCATDTHILIHEHEQYDVNADVNWLIMPQAFTALSKNCQQVEQVKIQLTENKNHVLYRFGNTIIMTNQVVGRFPDFRRVIPPTWDIDCNVDKSTLIDSLKRIKLLCDSTLLIKMDINRLDMTITVEDIDLMKRGKENITHNGSTGEIQIGANADFIRECANVFTDGDITMHMTDPSRPIVFVQGEGDNLQVLCMPMQLRGAN